MMKTSFAIDIDGIGRVLCEPRGAKGIYHASFWHQGEHVRRSLKTSNKKAAVKAAAPMIRAVVSAPQYYGTKSVDATFEVGKEAYLDTLRQKQCPKRTIQQSELHLTRFFSAMRTNGVDCFEQIGPYHADVFRRSIQAHPKTVANHYTTVKAMLRYCESRELIRRDPFARIPNQRPRLQKRRLPNLKEVNAILKKVERPYYEAIAALAFVGCRRSELCRLRVGDVDLVAGTIRFTAPTDVRSKTTEDRIVPIHPRLAEILKQYRRPRSEWFICAQPTPRNPKGGRPIKADLLNVAFKDAAKAAGLIVGQADPGGLTLHSLRGFFKTTAVLSGVPREIIDMWQGHKSDRSVSIRHYFNPSDDELNSWMPKVNFQPEPEE